ncbi:MAG: sugar kinase [Pseudomonadota bacterium]
MITAAHERGRRGVLSIGECMVELARRNDATFQIAYGGDTFNTAAYLKRLISDPVAYVTAVGDDPYSQGIIDAAAANGVDTDFIAEVADRMPGLYLIETAYGERSFWYWRDRAPAREMFEHVDVEAVRAAATQCALIYLSGITLSILDNRGRATLSDILQSARAAGALIAMDSNYRPRGWPGELSATRQTFADFWRLTDLALPTFDDEQALWGDQSPAEALERLGELGVCEMVIKCGPDGAVTSTRQTSDTDDRTTAMVPCPALVTPIDTTAAGDSFNAAYLAARLTHQQPKQAATFAHTFACRVINHRGAIIPEDATADLVQAFRNTRTRT